MDNLLRLSGSDIIAGISVVDEDGNSITSSQTIKFNFQRKSDSKWWNGSSWAAGSEPTLITAAQVNSTGIYEYTLTGGFSDNTIEFTVHVEATVTLIQNFYVNVILDTGLFIKATMFGAAVSGTLSDTQMSTDLVETTNDHFKGRVITWLTGPLAGQSSPITGYNGGTKVLTYTQTTDSPVNTNKFIIT